MKRSPSSSFSSGQTTSTTKRVKLSTSPGELRVDRDVEHLLLHHHWNEVPPSSRDRCGAALELRRKNASLIRDPVDPLRMRLVALHREERWVYHIRIPRMYPHVPPDVYRVCREAVDRSPFGAVSSLYCHPHSSSASSRWMVASSVMQRGAWDPYPVPERIEVRSRPPPGSDNQFRRCDSDDSMEVCRGGDDTAAVYDRWSPVSSLGELLDFLIRFPERRRNDDGRGGSNRTLEPCGGRSLVTPVNLPGVPSTVRHQQQQHQHQQQQQQQQQQYRPSSPCDMEEDVAENATTIRGTSSPFVTNRFDVGYERRVVR